MRGNTVVWNVVQEHGGCIEVKSDSSGTNFEIQLPVDRMQPSENPQQEKALVLGAGQSVLVVDDDEQQRMIAAGMLERLGYKVASACNGEEAIRLMGVCRYELVLLDMIMPPGMGGRETYEAILAAHPGQKALLTSGFSGGKEVQRALGLGATGFLRKPYTTRQLASAIAEALG